MITAVAILGPTASGKSRLAMTLAQHLGGEILSVDSRQAYRHLDIGTAKPTAEDRRAIPHHLIDILELHEKNNAEQFAGTAHRAIREVAARERLPIVVGGSGLYFRAIRQGLFSVKLDPAERSAFSKSLCGVADGILFRRLEEVDPESAGRIHRNDRYRITRALEVFALTGTPLSEHLRTQGQDPQRREIRFMVLGLDMPRAELHQRIQERARMMFEAGWVEETGRLLAGGADPEWPGMKTLGYPQVIQLINGKSTRDQTMTRVVELTRQYAKRQITWFKRESGIEWLTGDARGVFDAALARARGATGNHGASG